jgi:hypothetical protein
LKQNGKLLLKKFEAKWETFRIKKEAEWETFFIFKKEAKWETFISLQNIE